MWKKIIKWVQDTSECMTHSSQSKMIWGKGTGRRGANIMDSE